MIGDLRHISYYLATALRKIADDNEERTLNTCTFTGRVVADADLRATNSGSELCKFRLASDTGWGERKATHWLDCLVFGERGKAVQPHLRKGDPVTVVGDLQVPRTYQANNGETRVAQDLIVRELAMQGGKRQEGTQEATGDSYSRGGYQDKGQGRQWPSAGSHAAPGGQTFDDDIPFAPYLARHGYLI